MCSTSLYHFTTRRRERCDEQSTHCSGITCITSYRCDIWLVDAQVRANVQQVTIQENQLTNFKLRNYTKIIMSSPQVNTTHLLKLPRELRSHILRDLLIVDRAPRHGIPTCNTAKAFHCQECIDELVMLGSTTFPEVQILRVCRQLHDEGRDILFENEMIAIRDNDGISQEAVDRVNLGCWNHVNNVQTVMTFEIQMRRQPSTSPTLGKTCMFLLADYGRVARLLHTYGLQFPLFRDCSQDAISVYIHKIHVPTLSANPETARSILLTPFWSCLNGNAVRIAGEGFEVNRRKEEGSPYKYVIETSPGYKASPHLRRFAEFAPTREGALGPWDTRDFEFDLYHWEDIFRNLAYEGTWKESNPWQFELHWMSHLGEDQLRVTEYNTDSYIDPALGRMLAHRDMFHFTAAVLYMNLAHASSTEVSYVKECLSKAKIHFGKTWEEVGMPPVAGGDYSRADAFCCLMLRMEIEAADSDFAQSQAALKTAETVIGQLAPATAGSDWIKVRKHQIATLSGQLPSSGKKAQRRWKEDNMFRARFFRWYTRKYLLPLIGAKFEDEFDSFRDAVPRRPREWAKTYFADQIAGQWWEDEEIDLSNDWPFGEK